jgi:hypothetical protein
MAMAKSRKKKSDKTSFSSVPLVGTGDDRIAARAYELYLARGGSHGQALEDWLEAERQVLNPESENSSVPDAAR